MSGKHRIATSGNRPDLNQQFKDIYVFILLMYYHGKKSNGDRWSLREIASKAHEYAENNPAKFTPGVFNETAVRRFMKTMVLN